MLKKDEDKKNYLVDENIKVRAVLRPFPTVQLERPVERSLMEAGPLFLFLHQVTAPLPTTSLVTLNAPFTL